MRLVSKPRVGMIIVSISCLAPLLLWMPPALADITTIHHDSDNSAWGPAGLDIAGQKAKVCMPCHMNWDAVTSGTYDSYDVDTNYTLVVNNLTRVASNCINCHNNTSLVPPSKGGVIVSSVSASVHGDLEARCLSCHTMLHAGHSKLSEDSETGYLGCDGDCHRVMINPSDAIAPTYGDKSFMRIYAYNFIGPKPPAEAALLKVLYNVTDGTPFGQATKHVYTLYVDPYSKDPTQITSNTRYLVCFSCHYITEAPSLVGVFKEVNGVVKIGIPEAVLNLIQNSHAIKSLEEYELVEKREESNLPVSLIFLLVMMSTLLIVVLLLRTKKS